MSAAEFFGCVFNVVNFGWAAYAVTSTVALSLEDFLPATVRITDGVRHLETEWNASTAFFLVMMLTAAAAIVFQ